MAFDKVIDSAVLEANLTSVADAIRAKSGTSEALAFPSGFVAAVEELDGGGLNFEVIGGTTEPTNPKENTIWINTDAEITNYVFSATEPETSIEGTVWIGVGTSSSTAFLVTKKDAIMIYPVFARQYISGEWVDVSTKIYQDSEWKSLARLPSEYQEVEYLQTTGTQYIDTGIIPSANIYQVSTKVVTTTTEQNIVLIGTGSNTYYHLTPFTNKWWVGQQGADAGYGSYPATVGTEYEIEFNNADHAVVINGEVLCSGKSYSSGASIKMARRTTMGSASGGKFKYYYFKVINNSIGEPIMDLVPCYRRSDLIAGMYDLVSGKFFTNAGSDTFITGNKVV